MNRNTSRSSELLTDDLRARRLVTLSVGFRFVTDSGAILEGFTTGLNERGLAGRANLTSGLMTSAGSSESTESAMAPSPSALGDQACLSVRLNLDPTSGTLPDFHAELQRLDSSWVPGFRYFVVLHFNPLPPETMEFLRRFIAWREDQYFTVSKPLRDWYVWSRRLNETCGPLTRGELAACLHAAIFSADDAVWSPKLADWQPLDNATLESLEASDENNAPAANALERRLPRFVATPVALRLSGANGLVLDGYSTGLNEHGVGCRVNQRGGLSGQAAPGLPVKIDILLPNKSLQPIFGMILRCEPSWVPGMQLFVAVKFDHINESDFDYLKRFITFRDQENMIEAQPERSWYVHVLDAFRMHQGRTFGPLTTLEVLQAARAASLGADDFLWSPVKRTWLPFTIETFHAMAPDIMGDERVAMEAAAGQLPSLPTDADANATPAQTAETSRNSIVHELDEAHAHHVSDSMGTILKLTLQILIILLFLLIVLYHACHEYLDPRFIQVIESADRDIRAAFGG